MKEQIEIQGGERYGEIGLEPVTYYGEIEIQGSGQRLPTYTGPTMVTPEAYDMQILQTENKTVKENILVMPVPYSETVNPHGGTTVCIG